MKQKHTLIISLLAFLSSAGLVDAQTPSDDIMMKQLEACVAVTYEYSWFDEYWEGSHLRSNATIAKVKRHMYTPMLAMGIFDWLNLLVSTPYVSTYSTDPNGGKFAGAKGFQDLNLALKGRILNKRMGKGSLAVLATVGFSTPMSDYLSDYRPYSIGSGAPELTFRGIAHYQMDNGLYARGALAYVWRGQTDAERDYYYNNGSFYSYTMDVPNAWNYHLVAGAWLFDYSLRLEASYQGLNSTSGDDIRAYNAPQPTNEVDSGQVGFFSQYYFKKLKGLGVLAYFNQTVSGRNVGKSSIVGAGFTYVFSVGKSQ